jgi:hypothetical protein
MGSNGIWIALLWIAMLPFAAIPLVLYFRERKEDEAELLAGLHGIAGAAAIRIGARAVRGTIRGVSVECRFTPKTKTTDGWLVATATLDAGAPRFDLRAVARGAPRSRAAETAHDEPLRTFELSDEALDHDWSILASHPEIARAFFDDEMREALRRSDSKTRLSISGAAVRADTRWFCASKEVTAKLALLVATAAERARSLSADATARYR